jgi:hypothetical protein
VNCGCGFFWQDLLRRWVFTRLRKKISNGSLLYEKTIFDHEQVTTNNHHPPKHWKENHFAQPEGDAHRSAQQRPNIQPRAWFGQIDYGS